MNNILRGKRGFQSLLITFAMLLLCSCAVFDIANPESPTISIERVKAKSFGSAAQRLEIELLIENPNRFDLQIQSVDFTAFVNGDKLAKGGSDQFINVPALGEAVMEVQVILGLEQLFSEASKLLTEPETGPLNYSIAGTVSLENWPSAIPFNVDGEYSNPVNEP